MTLLPLLLSSLHVATAGPSAEVGVTVEPQVVVDLAADHPQENQWESWSRLRAWARIPAHGGTWRFEARGLHMMQSGGQEFSPAATEPSWELELGETAWQGSFGSTRLAIGNRVETWGSLYLLSTVDVLNGRDLRAGPLTPLELSRVPAPMITVEHRLWKTKASRAGAELSVLPIGASDRVSLIGTNWSMLKPGMVEGLIEDMSGWDGDALTQGFLQETVAAMGSIFENLSPQARSELSSLANAQASGSTIGEDLEMALRLQTRLGRHDINFMGAWYRARQSSPILDPLLQSLLREQRLPGLAEQTELLNLANSGVSLQRPRTWFAGMDWASWAGPFSFRAEGSWTQNRTIPTQWLGIRTSPSITAGAGVEWIQSSAFTIMLEANWSRLTAAPDCLWLTQEDHVQAALAGRVSLFADRLHLQPTVLWDASFGEWMLRPGLSWRPRDALRMDLALLLLTAQEPAPRDFLEAMETPLGPIGYASDNDSLVLSMTWIQ